MDIINKHYEKIILVICLVLMVWGLMKVGGIVRTANAELEHDEKTHQSKINVEDGEMVADFDPAIFKSKEEWIQRVKTDEPAAVRQISEIVSKAVEATAKKDVGGNEGAPDGEAIIRAWDRRYFNMLTRHSRKPIEEAEAQYRLNRNRRELESLKKSIELCRENIRKRIEENGDEEDDAKLAELRLQLDGFQALLANTEMDIVDLNKRMKYISMFCTPQGSLVDPQEIVCCPNPNCGALMLSNVDVCQFCGATMPIVNPAEQEDKDSDMDGLPDSFEKEHMQKRGFLTADVQQKLGLGNQAGMPQDGAGMDMQRRGGMMGMDGSMENGNEQSKVLNPYVATDACMDFDGDSFTNLEEYRFGTDIDDADSFPDPANYVRLVEFKRDVFPVRFMGVKEGRGAGEERGKTDRAKFSFMLNFRNVTSGNSIGVKEYWNNNEDSWETVRIGKKFDAPDGKSYVVDELGSEEVDGKSKAFVKISEYVPAARGKLRGKDDTGEKERQAASYKLYEGEDGHYNEWYAHLIFLANRSYGMLPVIYNNRYRVASGARNYFIRTRFKLEEGATLKIQIPIAKEDKTKQEKKQDKGPRFNRLAGQNAMNDMGGGMGGEWRSSPEVELKTFEYKLGKFDRTKKCLVLTGGEGKKVTTMLVKVFKEEENYTLPDSRRFPLFYQGGNSGFGGDGGMMEPGMGGMGGNPGMMLPPRRQGGFK